MNSVAWAPAEFGLHLATASSDGKVCVLSHRVEDDAWDVATIEDCPVGSNAVAWAPALPAGDGSLPMRRLATAGCDGLVRVYACGGGGGDRWALETPPLVRPGAPREWVRDVAWCPAGLAASSGLGADASSALLLASAGDDGTVCLWRPPSAGAASAEWSLSLLPPFPAPVWRLSWSVTGRLLAVSCGDNSVTLWKEELSGVWQTIGGPPSAN